MNSDQLQQEEPEVLVEKSTDQHEERPTNVESSNENENTEAAEETVQEDAVTAEETPKVDYSTYSKLELVNALSALLNSDDLLKRRDEIEEIRNCFYAIRKEEIEKEKALFEKNTEEDDVQMDFKPTSDPYEADIRRLVNEFHKLRQENAKQLEVTRANNLKNKKDIIEQIKDLEQADESIPKKFEKFKELQKTFHEIGSVPQVEVRGLWDSYNHAVELFFEFVKIDRELRDLDYSKNMDQKVQLCLLAEKLGTNEDVIDAFYRLQNLHEKWREVGPVARDDRETIWKRFSDASQVVNQRHHQYYDDLREQQRVIIEQKRELCNRADELSQADYPSLKEIREASDAMLALQKEWKELPVVHRKEGREVWEDFKKANDAFFERKRALEDVAQEGYKKNYENKLALCDRAEELSQSEDWKRTTNQLIQLQKDWTKVGPAPRKYSDKVWKRFRSACDLFFQRKTEHFNKLSEGEGDNLILKEALIVEVEAFEPTGGVKADLTQLKEFQSRWNAIGFVPIKKKEEVTLKFRKILNEKYNKINVDEAEKRMLNLKIQLDDMASSGGGKDKIYKERDFLARKLKQFETDKQTAENNLGFFTGNKNNPLLMNLNQKVDKIQKQMDEVKEKIALIDEMLDSLR